MRSNFLIVSLISPLVLFAIITISSCADKKNSVLPETGPTLTVSIDSTLDGPGEIKTASITSAILSDTTGTALKTAQISNGQAIISLSQINSGNYFLTINGLAQNRMPVRILAVMDSMPDMTQLVARTLDRSLIIVGIDTLFRIKTFFRGQGEPPVRQFSDGANVSPEEYPYAIESSQMGHGIIEVRVDSTAHRLYIIGPPGHGGNVHPAPYPAWILGELNHGRRLAGDPDSTRVQCQGCHPNFDVKPANYDQLSPMNGLCYGCHYGIGGTAAGFVDPAR